MKESKIEKYLNEASGDYSLDLLEFDKETEDMDDEIYSEIDLDIGSCCALCAHVSSGDLFQVDKLIFCNNSKILKIINDRLKAFDEQPVKKVSTNGWQTCFFYKENNQARSMGS